MNTLTQEQRWDHERDLRKHDVPLRLEPKMPTALEVALIVRGLQSPTEGADLIEQYARTKASEAKLEGVKETADRIAVALESPVRP